ncbi:hypothetical protein DL239_19860 [Sedimentitalea sp. CY04]|uniref:Peptidase S1 domain-containing protein n=1 Tax=Parasedimentitalea denitrificans TaxID=2211118 RepID=A0ABX0WFU7_9RHOB|nr:trypsin-like serine protease [Sedimentitalea sp. CY04]NIZ63225.1 hypothetical protein [Sedimentitalea sp. CY04]
MKTAKTLLSTVLVFGFSNSAFSEMPHGLIGDAASKSVVVGTSFTHIQTAEVHQVILHSSSEQNSAVPGSEFTHENDKRVRKSTTSPAVLDAVGRLEIDDESGKQFGCSGTLIGLRSDRPSRVVISSAHCLKNGSMTWETTTKAGKNIKLSAEIIPEYYNFDLDYAILLLEQNISNSDVQPLILDYEWEEDFDALAVNYKNNTQIIVAGYSTDKEIGDSGKVLTYVEDEILIGASNTVFGGHAQAFTYGGASGGAVIVMGIDVENEEANYGEQNYLIGVIKGGLGSTYHASSNGVPGNFETVFTKYEHFLEDVKLVASEYN